MSNQMVKGNTAVVIGAMYAGCDCFFGYPITPASEILHEASKYFPMVGRNFVQAESEEASINMVYGAAAAGMRVMTSSSSPGISLKTEGLSYIAGSDVPALVVNVQRGGPGLGGIQPSQSDYFQATKGGGHGDYRMIVLAPASVQEMASLTMKGFDLADKYLVTSMILADGTIGQMMEPITFEDSELESYEKPWALTGTDCKRSHNIVNSLYLKPDELEKKNFERYEKYRIIEENEPIWEEYMMEDAEYCVVAFGIASHVAKNAVVKAREEGIKVGLIRPITLWPFPKAPFAKAADKVKSFISVELNMGQMVEDIKLATECKKPVSLCNRTGGMIPSPDEVLESIRKAVKGV